MLRVLLVILVFIVSVAQGSAQSSAELEKQIEVEKQNVLFLENYARQFQQLTKYDLNRFKERGISQSDLTQASLDVSSAKTRLANVEIKLADTINTINQTKQLLAELKNQQATASLIGDRASDKKPSNLVSEITVLESQLNYQNQLKKLLEKSRELASKLFTLEKTKELSYLGEAEDQQMSAKLAEINKISERLRDERDQWQKRLIWFNKELNRLGPVTEDNKAEHQRLKFNIIVAEEKVAMNQFALYLARLQKSVDEYSTSTRGDWTVVELEQSRDELSQLAKESNNAMKFLKEKMVFLDLQLKVLQEDKNHLGLSAEQYQEQQKLLKDLTARYLRYEGYFETLLMQITDYQTLVRQQLNIKLRERQRLPRFTVAAWMDLAYKTADIPGMLFSVVKTAILNIYAWVLGMGAAVSYFCGVMLMLWGGVYVFVRYQLNKAKNYFAKIHNRFFAKFLFVASEMLRRNLAVIFLLLSAILLNSIGPVQVTLFIYFLLIFIGFKMASTFVRVILLESEADVNGADVRLYHRLKWTFVVSGLFAWMFLLLYALPLDYEVNNLFYRIFMLALLFISILLFRGWAVVPKLLRSRIYEKRPYLFHGLRLLSLLVPMALFVDAVIGLLGYIDLAWTISKYQIIFIVILLGYLIIRGLVIDLLLYLSESMIRHIKNGWLLTEVFLKPVDRIVRILLFVSAIYALVIAYGLDHSEYFITQVVGLFHKPLFILGGNEFTLLVFIKITVAIAVLYWFARWSREFAYRRLFVKAKDVGVRHSLSVFTQYVIVIIGFFIGLRVLGIDLTGLAVVAAAFAAGLGFGLRDLANNFFSGILLLVERPFRTGDIVTLGEYEGTVVDTGMRSMTIRTWDRMEVIVPNSDMFTKPFVNWTHQDSIVRSVIKIKINRKDDPTKIRKLVLQVLADLDNVVDEPEPQVLMIEVNDWLLEMEVRFFINLQVSKSRALVRSEVSMAIVNCFKEHGITEPYPRFEGVLTN